MSDCLFCKIINGEIPSKKLYEDEKILAFYDISPIAPVHFLVIPKQHISSVDAIDADNSAIVAYIFQKLGELAKLAGIENGYRVISNCGADAGQTVQHLHFHVLGGKEMNWQV
ncbi:MAG: histidine triad nucleotide-binding protein [Negativibacillus sp.]|nr:histidine triad nucleotide-binding protein [Negativibacillus sp.]